MIKTNKSFIGGFLLLFTTFLLLTTLGLVAQAAPIFGSISPDNGPDTGGTNVTIIGSEFRNQTNTPINIPNSTGSVITSQAFPVKVDTTGFGTTDSDCRDNINFYDDDDSPLVVRQVGVCGTTEYLYVVQVPNIPIGGKTITMSSGVTVTGFADSTAPNYREWLDSENSGSTARMYGMDIEGDSDGNIYVLYAEQLSSGSSFRDSKLVKFDRDTGARIWTRDIVRTATGTGIHHIRTYQFRIDSSDNIIIPGQIFSEGIFEFEDTVGTQTIDNQTLSEPGFVVIYNKDGDIQSLNVNNLFSSAIEINEVEIDATGNIYASVYQSPNYNITKLDPTGTAILWSQDVPGDFNDITSFIVHSDGLVYTVAEMQIQKLDPTNGSLVWSKSYGGSNYRFSGVSENSDGTLLVSANGIASGPYTVTVDALSETSGVSAGIFDSFITTIDQAGVPSDITFLGRSLGVGDAGHARDNAGNIYAYEDQPVKFSPTGQLLGFATNIIDGANDVWFDPDDSHINIVGDRIGGTAGLLIEEINIGSGRYRYTTRFETSSLALGTPQSILTDVELDGLTCNSINVVSSTELNCVTPAHAPGQVDVVLENPGETISGASTGSDAYTYNQTETIISSANYGTSTCSPNPATIGVDVLTCTIDLVGNPSNDYQLPVGGIVANIDGLGDGDNCVITNNTTPSAQLVCSNIPTTGGSTGPINVNLNDSSVISNIDNVTLISNTEESSTTSTSSGSGSTGNSSDGVTINPTINNLIRSGGQLTKGVDNLRLASGLLFLSSTILLGISYSLRPKKGFKNSLY